MAQTPAPKAATAKAAAAKTAAPKTATVTTARPTPKKAATTTKRAVVAAKPATPAPLATDDEKIVYAIGLSIQRNLARFDLSPAEVEIIKRGIGDGAAGRPEVKIDEWGPKIESLAQGRAAKLAEKEKAASQAFLEKAAGEPGAVKTASGLIYRELRPGTGVAPKDTDTVRVNYRGTLVNCTEFDSSYRRNEPAQFKLKEVIPCWTEGVQLMKPGGKSVLVCPSGIAYGDRTRGPIPGGAALIFEVELLEVVQVAK